MRFPTRNAWGPPVASVLCVLALVAILRAQGRVWWCSCGSLSPVSLDAYGRHNSQHFFDPYSLSHFLHGVVFSGVLVLVARGLPYAWRASAAVLLECGWELFENSPFVIDRYRTATAAVGYVGDSVLNSVADVVSCAVGFWFAGRIGLRKSVALFVAIELAMLAMMRDNLSLNVLMLIAPSASVRAWQTGA
jgi:hypothetical protein